jgi:hypothetical protein
MWQFIKTIIMGFHQEGGRGEEIKGYLNTHFGTEKGNTAFVKCTRAGPATQCAEVQLAKCLFPLRIFPIYPKYLYLNKRNYPMFNKTLKKLKY